MLQNQEFINEFITEALGHIETVESGLLRIDHGDVPETVIHEIFRAMHSVKGTAGFFGLQNIVKLAHAMENLMGEIRNGAIRVDQTLVDTILMANDAMKTMVANIEQSEEYDLSRLISELQDLIDGKVRQSSPSLDSSTQYQQEGYQETAAAMEASVVMDEHIPVIKSVAIPTDFEAQIQADERAVIDLYPEVEPEQQVITGEEPQKQSPIHSEDTIRVHVSLLNDLLNLASEMVLGRNQLLRNLEMYRKSIPGLDPVLQNIDHITTELQEKIMQTRMQPVSKVFNKFPRIIRELSKMLKKEVRLHMDGTEVELDKSIIEMLVDPLTHLVRNAIDHGIEMPDVREQEGKPKAGSITLKAYHEGGQVNIDVIDDGLGISIEHVEKRAIEKGVITAAEAARLGERELLSLLFHPGFSTTMEITDVSGRGVGLDVVKTNIEKLGGTVGIITKLGHGTTFRLTLPLTVAIIPSLIVEVNGQKFALPQVNLQEMVRVKPGDPQRKIEEIHGSYLLRLRGRLLPIVHLSDVLGLPRDPSYLSLVVKVLILKSGYKRFGLVVDMIHDDEEILVKSLPKYLSSCKCYSGVTILGDGKTAMILDPEGIVEQANFRFTQTTNELRELEQETEDVTMREQQNLIVFRCSGPEMFCLDLSLVARVEKIDASQIEQVGEKEFIQYRGEALRVIRPETYLPVNQAASYATKKYVIIPKLTKHKIGILIEEIHDTVVTSISFNQDDMKAKGLFGSATLFNRLVLFINIYELFEMADPEHFAGYVHDTIVRDQKTVLLVEDTPFFSKVEKNYLESVHYRVLVAANGKEALKILREEPVDAVVSDIYMPIMDGIELVRRIRSDKTIASLPVIAVTSVTDEKIRQSGMEAGFDYYVVKLDKQRMLETLELAFQKRGDQGI